MQRQLRLDHQIDIEAVGKGFSYKVIETILAATIIKIGGWSRQCQHHQLTPIVYSLEVSELGATGDKNNKYKRSRDEQQTIPYFPDAVRKSVHHFTVTSLARGVGHA
jgi:hypothetical protein